MSRTPGDRSPSTAGGTCRGCTGSTAGANVRPVHRGAPRLEPPDMFGVQHGRRPPRVSARAGAAGGEARGAYRGGDSPRRSPRYRRVRGSDRLDVVPVASPCPRGLPGTPSRPGRAPVRDGRTPREPRRGCTGSTARRTRRPLPGYTTPAGDRDLAPHRDVVPSGNGFLVFRNPFPRSAGASDAPYDLASRAYGGRTGANSPASPPPGPLDPVYGGLEAPSGAPPGNATPWTPSPGVRRGAATCCPVPVGG